MQNVWKVHSISAAVLYCEQPPIISSISRSPEGRKRLPTSGRRVGLPTWTRQAHDSLDLPHQSTYAVGALPGTSHHNAKHAGLLTQSDMHHQIGNNIPRKTRALDIVLRVRPSMRSMLGLVLTLPGRC